LSVRRARNCSRRVSQFWLWNFRELVEPQDIKKIEEKLMEFRKKLTEFPKGSQLPK
jgi:hypothetical protein